MLPPPAARVQLLASEADWAAARPWLEALETSLDPNPWATWWHAWSLWHFFHPGERCWLLAVEDGAGPLAALLLLECRSRRRLGSVRVLRSLDSLALRLPPLWLRRGDEEAGCAAAARALPALARASGAHLAALYRADGPAAGPWSRALAARGLPVRRRTFTLGQQVLLGDDLEADLRRRCWRQVRDVRRLRRRLERERGPVQVLRRRGGLHDAGGRELWQGVEAVRRRSWQHRWAEDSGRVDNRVLDAWLSCARNEWARRGWLDLSLLAVAGRPAAYKLNLAVGGRLWMLFMAHDPEFRRHGAGNILFLEELHDLHARGERCIELGGECLDWKRKWANAEVEMLELEWPLGGLPGALWRVARRLRREDSQRLVRTGAENDLD